MASFSLLLRNGLSWVRGSGSLSAKMRCTYYLSRFSVPGASIGRFYAIIPNTMEYMKRKDVLDAVNMDIESVPVSKLFAVVHLAGRQHKITTNDLLVVNTLEAETGAQIFLNKVLLAGSGNFTLIGRPLIDPKTVRVKATVIEHLRLKKVTVFKKKRRKNYKKTRGHRQDSTVLRINAITVTPNLT